MVETKLHCSEKLYIFGRKRQKVSVNEEVAAPKGNACCYVSYPVLSDVVSGQFSSVGIAIDNGLEGSGSNPGGNKIFRPS